MPSDGSSEAAGATATASAPAASPPPPLHIAAGAAEDAANSEPPLSPQQAPLSPLGPPTARRTRSGRFSVSRTLSPMGAAGPGLTSTPRAPGARADGDAGEGAGEGGRAPVHSPLAAGRADALGNVSTVAVQGTPPSTMGADRAGEPTAPTTPTTPVARGSRFSVSRTGPRKRSSSAPQGPQAAAHAPADGSVRLQSDSSAAPRSGPAAPRSGSLPEQRKLSRFSVSVSRPSAQPVSQPPQGGPISEEASSTTGPPEGQGHAPSEAQPPPRFVVRPLSDDQLSEESGAEPRGGPAASDADTTAAPAVDSAGAPQHDAGDAGTADGRTGAAADAPPTPSFEPVAAEARRDDGLGSGDAQRAPPRRRAGTPPPPTGLGASFVARAFFSYADHLQL